MTNFKFALSLAVFLLALIASGVYFTENLYTQQDNVIQCKLTGGACIDLVDHQSVCENASGSDNFIITDRGCPTSTVCCVPQKTIQTI